MSRKSSRPDSHVEILEEAVEVLPFEPNKAQQQAKARFWVNYRNNPLVPVDELTKAEIVNMAGTESIRKWWNLSGFESWFLNRQEFTERIEYLANLSLDALEQIIVNQDPKAQAARVNAIKVVSELAHKMPKKEQSGSNQFLDRAISSIASMDAVQLQAFLEKQGAKLQISVGGKNDGNSDEEADS